MSLFPNNGQNALNDWPGQQARRTTYASPDAFLSALATMKAQIPLLIRDGWTVNITVGPDGEVFATLGKQAMIAQPGATAPRPRKTPDLKRRL